MAKLPTPQSGQFEYQEQGREHFLNVRYIPELEWYLFVDKQDKALAGIRQGLYINLLLCLLVTAIGKYWICKRAPTMIAEASECLGGAGYVEETILPRLYREAPVNSIWEGSGNVQCLDVLRALSEEPGVLEVLFAELGDGHGDARLKVHIQRLKAAFGDTEDIQYRARQLTEEVAVTLQAKLLLEAGDAAVSDAFIASRLDGHGRVHGTLPRGLDIAALLARSAPHL